MIRTLMKSALLAVFAASLQVSFPATAEAQISVAEGRRCNFSAVTDLTIENGEVLTGQVNGGPMTATAPGASISLKCTIQVGAANATHNGSDSASALSSTTVQTAVVPPTLFSVLAPAGQPVYTCLEATINLVTWYFDATNETWSVSSAVTCFEAISQETLPGPASPVLDALDATAQPWLDSVEEMEDGTIHQPCSLPLQLHCYGNDQHCVLWIQSECQDERLPKELIDVNVILCLQVG